MVIDALQFRKNIRQPLLQFGREVLIEKDAQRRLVTVSPIRYFRGERINRRKVIFFKTGVLL